MRLHIKTSDCVHRASLRLTDGRPSSYPPGLTGKEKDVKIIHAKGDEWVWFYLPVFAVPLLMLGLGFWFSGRPGMKRGA